MIFATYYLVHKRESIPSDGYKAVLMGMVDGAVTFWPVAYYLGMMP